MNNYPYWKGTKATGPGTDLVTQFKSIRCSTELKMLGEESWSPSDPGITELGKTCLSEFFLGIHNKWKIMRSNTWVSMSFRHDPIMSEVRRWNKWWRASTCVATENISSFLSVLMLWKGWLLRSHFSYPEQQAQKTNELLTPCRLLGI